MGSTQPGTAGAWLEPHLGCFERISEGGVGPLCPRSYQSDIRLVDLRKGLMVWEALKLELKPVWRHKGKGCSAAIGDQVRLVS
jgi:hypothetical protein